MPLKVTHSSIPNQRGRVYCRIRGGTDVPGRLSLLPLHSPSGAPNLRGYWLHEQVLLSESAAGNDGQWIGERESVRGREERGSQGIGGHDNVWPFFIKEDYGSGISVANSSAFEKCDLAGERVLWSLEKRRLT